MIKYYKIWLKPKDQQKIKTLYILENGALPVAQILFDKLPYGVSLAKYEELNENQFERAKNSSHNYRNLEEALDEGFHNRVQE